MLSGTVTPMTTNRIQDWSFHPRAWFHHLASATGHRDHSHVTTTQPLRHTAPPHVPTTQPRMPQDLAWMNTSACDQPHYQPCSPRLALQYSPSWKLAKVPSIVTLLYLVPFHLCTLLFSSQLYHCIRVTSSSGCPRMSTIRISSASETKGWGAQTVTWQSKYIMGSASRTESTWRSTS